MRDSISPLFSPWQGCLVRSFALKRWVILLISGKRLNSLKSFQQLKHHGRCRSPTWRCDISGPLATRLFCHMSPRRQQDIRSSGLKSHIGGPTSTQLMEWSATWTAKKTWDDQVRLDSDCFECPFFWNCDAFLLTCRFPQRGFSFVDWTWRPIGATSPRTPSSPCEHWLMQTGGVWGSGWRSRNLGETMRASTSSLETSWAHFLYVLWLLRWTQNFYKRIPWDKARTCSFKSCWGSYRGQRTLRELINFHTIIFTLLMIAENAEKHASEPSKSTSSWTVWVRPGVFILITNVLYWVRIY